MSLKKPTNILDRIMAIEDRLEKIEKRLTSIENTLNRGPIIHPPDFPEKRPFRPIPGREPLRF